MAEMEIGKAIELLSDYCDRGSVTLDQDFKDAVRMGKQALILLSHRTTYCLDDHSLNLLREAQRKG
ncbi:hypothetical protein LCGC14_2970790 [marine sediment metagenome]|uniref:Uncharacterized protein n=1 Tax=marine sediment metagenome TaxID=412755 RepID=A0A0F8X9F2_9ZZZZ